MKAILLIFLIAFSHAIPITQEYLDKLSKTSSFETYKTVEEHPFKDSDEIKYRLGLNIATLKYTGNFERGFSNEELPENFDAREKWPECIHPIRNQAKCGSCWAHGASEVLSDRFCIHSDGKINVVLSPQDLVSCDPFDHGCNGGALNLSWLYLRIFGATTDACTPYTAQTGEVDLCNYNKCTVEGEEYKKYKALNYYSLNTINDLKKDLYENGPIETGFYVYDDFMSYKGGVYRRGRHTKLMGGHAVKIIGWGKEDNGDEYWIVANSWGTEWGENGFFRIGFGECGIENVMTGMPLIEE